MLIQCRCEKTICKHGLTKAKARKLGWVIEEDGNGILCILCPECKKKMLESEGDDGKETEKN